MNKDVESLKTLQKNWKFLMTNSKNFVGFMNRLSELGGLSICIWVSYRWTARRRRGRLHSTATQYFAGYWIRES